MKTLRTLLAACVLSLGLAACGEPSPVLTAPDGARFDGGHTYGSGHHSDSTTISDASTATADSDSTTTERGGSTFGSGH